MAINTHRITARLDKSNEELVLRKGAIEKAISNHAALDKAYLELESAPPMPLPEGATDEQIKAHRTGVEFYQDNLKRAAATAKFAFLALRDTEVANSRRIEALGTVIAQQTAALARKAAAYPALHKAHLRRRRNAGERIAKAA